MAIIAKISEEDPKPRRPRRLKSIALLPSLFTLGSLLCGFAAIYFALEAMYSSGAGIAPEEELTGNSELLERMLPSFISVGAGLVLIGMIFDSLDGLVARMTRSTTDFGGQLDSLADIVTCGVAPAILMIAMLDPELRSVGESLSPMSEDPLGRVGWAAAAVYLACAAVRLARFNVEHAKVDFDHRRFQGLPSPGAAAAICAFLIFQDLGRSEFGVPLPGPFSLGAVPSSIVVYVMPLLAVSCGLLMVSRIPYFKLTALVRGKKPLWQLLVVIALFPLVMPFKAAALLLCVVAYVSSGPVVVLTRRIRSRRSSAKSAGIDDDQEPQAAQTG